jgi:predicted DNA-binding transcriptional regulator AlpA
MTDRYLTRQQMADLFSVTTRTIDAWAQCGRLPKPDRLPSGRPRWPEAVAESAVRRSSVPVEHAA